MAHQLARLLKLAFAFGLALPFFGASSCVRDLYVLYEYELERCPPTGYELPQRVLLGNWLLNAAEDAPYCHGYLRYELTQQKKSEAFTDPRDEAVVYARLVRREERCRLAVITNTACAARESLEECEKRFPKTGAHPRTHGGIQDHADRFVERLFAAHSFTPKLPAAYHSFIGRVEHLESWCRSPTAVPPGESFPGVKGKKP